MAETFKNGDPAYAGSLAGVALGLKSYHIFELEPYIPSEVWTKEMAMYELEIKDETRKALLNTLEEIRSN